VDRPEVQKMDASEGRQLDPGRRSVESRDFKAGCGGKSLGSTKRCRRWWICAGVSRRIEFAEAAGGEIAVFGADRSGKTRVVEATAEVLFGDLRAVIKAALDFLASSGNSRLTRGFRDK
jgi:hypothetical protein